MKKLFIDVGVGKPRTEAWGREKDFTIIGFEPCPNRYNKLKPIYPGKLLNVAVSDEDSRRACWEDPKYGTTFFLTKEDKKRNFRWVIKTVIKLDSLSWQDFDEIHIWADIEGAELLMLKGATKMLSSGKVKWLNLEVRKVAPADDWATAKQVYDFLEKYGFKANFPLGQLHEKNHRDVIFKLK